MYRSSFGADSEAAGALELWAKSQSLNDVVCEGRVHRPDRKELDDFPEELSSVGLSRYYAMGTLELSLLAESHILHLSTQRSSYSSLAKRMNEHKCEVLAHEALNRDEPSSFQTDQDQLEDARP